MNITTITNEDYYEPSIEDNLNIITKIRILLHKYIYSNNENIQTLINIISSYFNLFNIEYIEETRSIRLKIKKTNIKKSPEYECTPKYFYTIFNNIMYSYFKTFESKICKTLYEDNSCTGIEYNYLYNPNNINFFYTITIILDNVIEIHL